MQEYKGRCYLRHKKIPFDYDDGDKYWREVRIMAGFNHKNTIRYYQAWEEKLLEKDPVHAILARGEEEDEPKKPRCLLIQMELCEMSLHKKVKIEDIAAERAWLCFRQIVEGVAYIHSKGVVHLDLTLKNILVDERWTIKITDFGLAKLCGDNSKVFNSDPSAGNVIYKAPELFVKGSPITPKADIYSLGMILFFLLYHFETKTEREEKRLELQKGEFPTDLGDRGGQSIILKLLSRIPSDRPSAAQILEMM